MKISEIKKHNKNIRNIILFINETENLKDYVYYEEWGYIDSIKKIFNAKKEIAKCYNNIVKNYNNIVKNINSINFQINENISYIEAYEKRAEDLKNEYAKMYKIYSQTTKPENYNKCLELEQKRIQCLEDLNATKTEKIVSKKHVDTARPQHIGDTTIMVHRSKDVDVEEIIIVPDTQKREKAKKELEIIESEIKNQANYEQNLVINELENQIISLNGVPKELIEKSKSLEKELDNLTKEKNNYTKILSYWNKLVEDEKTFIQQNNIDLSKCMIEEKHDIEQLKPNKIEEEYVSASFDDGFASSVFSIFQWKEKVNYYIDKLGINNIKKNDMTKIKEDIDYFDDDMIDD